MGNPTETVINTSDEAWGKHQTHLSTTPLPTSKQERDALVQQINAQINLLIQKKNAFFYKAVGGFLLRLSGISCLSWITVDESSSRYQGLATRPFHYYLKNDEVNVFLKFCDRLPINFYKDISLKEIIHLLHEIKIQLLQPEIKSAFLLGGHPKAFEDSTKRRPPLYHFFSRTDKNVTRIIFDYAGLLPHKPSKP